MPKANKKPELFTTFSIMRENLELAKKLCPEGHIFKFWMNGWMREKLLADLFVKENSNT